MQNPDDEDRANTQLPLRLMSESWKFASHACAERGQAPIGKNINLKHLAAFYHRSDNYSGMVELQTQIQQEYPQTPDDWAIVQLDLKTAALDEQSSDAQIKQAIRDLKYIIWMCQKHEEYDFLVSCLEEGPVPFNFHWSNTDVYSKIDDLTKKVLDGRVGREIKMSAVFDRNMLKNMIESASDHKQNKDTCAYLGISNIKSSKTVVTLKRALLEAEEEIRRLGGAQALLTDLQALQV